MPVPTSPFRPHPLVSGGHLQTLIGYYWFGDRAPYTACPHLVQLNDEDVIVLHDDCPQGWQHGDRVILMVPGLDGTHSSPFMQRIAAKLNTLGYRTFRMDLRGFGPAFHLSQHPGHAGRSEDTMEAILKIAELCPSSPVTIVGFSMGGNIVLKMLGEHGAGRIGLLDSCFAVAPPIDILSCSQNLLRPSNRAYGRSFANSLLQQVKQRRPYVKAMQSISLSRPPRTLMDFDDRFTAPLSGFRDAEDYYRSCSAKSMLSAIRWPTFILAAEDDPMIPVSIFDDVDLSDATQLHVANSGGHLGFFGVSGVDKDRRWMDWRIIDWIAHQDRNFGKAHPDCIVKSTTPTY